MQSVSDDDVQKRLLEKPRFELAAKGIFSHSEKGVPGLYNMTLNTTCIKLLKN